MKSVCRACRAVEQNKEWMSTDDWLLRHKKHLAIRDQGSYPVVFVGDSITEGWSGRGLEAFDRDLKNIGIANFGISGDATQHLLWRIENGVLDALNPEILTVLIGTNNLGNELDNGLDSAAGVAAVLAAIRERCPQSMILLHAVFPRDQDPNSAMRAEVNILNASIHKLVDGKQVQWLDISDRLCNADGTISESMMHDYLHISAIGYDIWCEELLQIFTKELR